MKNYVDKAGNVVADVAYVGSEACMKCHESAYEVWEKSAHSHAYKTLVDAKFPSNNQFDPECIVCHTVGFSYLSGYVSEEYRATLKKDKKFAPDLRNVGCESCHGPSSLHAANPERQGVAQAGQPVEVPAPR
jgi:hypothetical protein